MFKHITIKTLSKNGINDAVESFAADSTICVVINDDIEIIFVCLALDLEYLVYGYLSNIPKNDIKIISIKDNSIFVKINLSKEVILDILNKKDIVGTCEGIESANIKLGSKSIVVPFNDTRYKVNGDLLLKICAEFYCNKSQLYHSKITSLKSLLCVNCLDSNPNTNIYKILGMWSEELLHCVILLDFELTLDLLQKLIIARITFVIASKINNFSVLKYAQKFGLTIGYFYNNEIKILSHNSRII